MKIKNNIFVLLLILICSACDENTKYHSYVTIPTKGWSKSDTLFYNLPDTFSTGEYSLTIGLKHTDLYKYKNLWLEVRNNCNDSTHFDLDSVEVVLANKNGEWLGNGIGGDFQLTYDCPKYIKVNQQGSSYKIRINQIMTDNPLKEIEDVGIQVTKISD